MAGRTAKPSKPEIKLNSYDDLFGETPVQADAVEVMTRYLHDFENHPFHVKDDEDMAELVQSVRDKGMQDPEFAKAYEEIQPEMNVIRAMIEARTSQHMTQKELSERTGIAQTEISRLENGTRNPSIKLLQRLADGMGMVLNVTFTPKETAAGTKKI